MVDLLWTDLADSNPLENLDTIPILERKKRKKNWKSEILNMDWFYQNYYYLQNYRKNKYINYAMSEVWRHGHGPDTDGEFMITCMTRMSFTQTDRERLPVNSYWEVAMNLGTGVPCTLSSFLQLHTTDS